MLKENAVGGNNGAVTSTLEHASKDLNGRSSVLKVLTRVSVRTLRNSKHIVPEEGGGV